MISLRLSPRRHQSCKLNFPGVHCTQPLSFSKWHSQCHPQRKHTADYSPSCTRATSTADLHVGTGEHLTCKAPGRSTTKQELLKQSNSQIWHRCPLPRGSEAWAHPWWRKSWTGRPSKASSNQTIGPQIILWLHNKAFQLQQCALRGAHSFSQRQSWMYTWGTPWQHWQLRCWEIPGSRKHWNPWPWNYPRCAYPAL